MSRANPLAVIDALIETVDDADIGIDARVDLLQHGTQARADVCELVKAMKAALRGANFPLSKPKLHQQCLAALARFGEQP